MSHRQRLCKDCVMVIRGSGKSSFLFVSCFVRLLRLVRMVRGWVPSQRLELLIINSYKFLWDWDGGWRWGWDQLSSWGTDCQILVSI